MVQWIGSRLSFAQGRNVSPLTLPNSAVRSLRETEDGRCQSPCLPQTTFIDFYERGNYSFILFDSIFHEQE